MSSTAQKIKEVKPKFAALLVATLFLFTSLATGLGPLAQQVLAAESIYNSAGPVEVSDENSYNSGAQDVSGHENLAFSFNYEDSSLDGSGSDADSFTYKFFVDGTNVDSQTIDGQSGDSSAVEFVELDQAELVGASNARLEVSVNGTSDGDIVELTNISLTGDPLSTPYVFPSTNNDNKDAGNGYVEKVSATASSVTLNFVNPNSSIMCFEYRTDGDTGQDTGNTHPLETYGVTDSLTEYYPYLCLSDDSEIKTFNPNQYVEIRSAFGAERNWDFDWTRIDTATLPTNQVVVVNENNLNGWYFAADSGGSGSEGNGGFVEGPATPPLGNGSAQLTVDDDDRHVLGLNQYRNLTLGEIAELSYSTYRQNGNEALAPSLQFNIDTDNSDIDTSWQGRLTYEPYFGSQAVQDDVWQTWDALNTTSNGNWWFSGEPGNAECPQSNPCTWGEVLTAFPNAAIRDADYTGLISRAGGPWSGGFSGNVDNFTIATQTFNTTYDFEPVDSTNPVIEVTAPAASSHVKDNVQFIGSVTDNEELSYYYYHITGPENVPSITVYGERENEVLNGIYPGQQYWNTNEVPDGNYVVHFVALDKAGNISTHDLPLTVDNEAPVLTDFNLSDTLIGSSDNTPTLTGNVEDQTSSVSNVKYVIWKEVGGNPKGEIARNWTNLPADDGNYDSKQEAIDSAINVSGLSDGTYTLGVRGWDAAGNKGSGGDLVFKIDRTIPTVVLQAPTPENGETVKDTITIQALFEDEGGLKNTYCGIHAQGWSFAKSWPANGVDSCTYDTTTLDDGVYYIRVAASDKAGNGTLFSLTNTDVSRKIIVDNTKPGVSIDNPSNGDALNTKSFTVYGTASDANGVASVSYKVTEISGPIGCNNCYVGTVDTGTANGLNNWNFDVSGVSDGFYRLKVTVFDNAGNRHIKYHDVRVDTTAPVIQAATLENVNNNDDTGAKMNTDGKLKLTLTTNEEILGWKSQAFLMRTSADGGAITLSRVHFTEVGTNKYTAYFDLNESPLAGNYTKNMRLRFKLYDTLTNGSSWTYLRFNSANDYDASADVYRFSVDNERPNVTFTWPEGFDSPFQVGPTLQIEVSDNGSGVNPNNASLHVYKAGDDSFTTAWCNSTTTCDTSELPDGTYYVKAGVNDNAGNNQTLTQYFTIDDTAPVLTVNDPTPNSDGTYTFSGTTDDPSSPLVVKLDGTMLNDITISDNNWSVTVPNPGEGSHAVTVDSTDAAGNVATQQSASFSVLGASTTTEKTEVNKPAGNNRKLSLPVNTNPSYSLTGNSNPDSNDAQNNHNNDNGEVKGEETANLDVNNKDKQANTAANTSFLGLGWWWVPILAALLFFFLALFRRSGTNQKAS